MLATFACREAAELRPLIYLGTIKSYGIYIWQGIFPAMGRTASSPMAADPLVGAVQVAVAALSYHFFEEPILRYKDRLGRLSRSEI